MVDFSIEPEFQAKLDWMEGFVRDRVYPLEYLYDYDKDAPYDIQNAGLRKIVRRLQQEVQAQGMWAAHLPAHLGGPLGTEPSVHAYEPFSQFPDEVLDNIPNAFGRHATDAVAASHRRGRQSWEYADAPVVVLLTSTAAGRDSCRP